MSNEVKETDVKEAEGTTATETKAPAKTVRRRGVASARGVQRLKFSHEHAQQNGLFLMHLDSVAVSMITIGADTTGMPSFNDMEIPKLTLTFASNEEDVNARKYETIQLNAVESNVNTIPGAKEDWKVNAILDLISHIINVYVKKGAAYTPEEEEALSLPFIDFDENGDYTPVEAEEVIAGWKHLFDNVENILNRGKDGQPAFKTKDGKDIIVWGKLLRHTKNRKKEWVNVRNGDLGFPTFIGEGIIEIFKPNTKPNIRIDAVKESIIPQQVKDRKSGNAASNVGGMGAPSMGGVPMDNMMGGGGFDAGFPGSGVAQDDDLPF